MPDKLESTKPFDFRKLIELAYLIVILSAFSWAKEFLLPIVLAILISFLLTPIVSRIERWGFSSCLGGAQCRGGCFCSHRCALRDGISRGLEPSKFSA